MTEVTGQHQQYKSISNCVIWNEWGEVLSELLAQ